MAREFGTDSAQSLEEVVLLQKISVFRRCLQTETDEAIRQRVKFLFAQAEAELACVDAQADAPPENDFSSGA